MARRRAAEKREILSDPKFGDLIVAKFVNNLMLDGKKSIAESIMYDAFDRIQSLKKSDPIEIFHKALENVRPHLEVKSRRVGGATYQVPMEVSDTRAQALAIRWLIANSRKRGEKTMKDRLSSELIEASESRGASVKKREDTHKMAEANKAFAHFRW